MKETLYERKGRVIINLKTKEAKHHESNNLARRASRQIQIEADRALGLGTLRRVK